MLRTARTRWDFTARPPLSRRASTWSALGSTRLAGLPVLVRSLVHLLTSWRLLPATLAVQAMSAIVVVVTSLGGNTSVADNMIVPLTNFGFFFASAFVVFLLQYSIPTGVAIESQWYRVARQINSIAWIGSSVSSSSTKTNAVNIACVRLLDAARIALYAGNADATAVVVDAENIHHRTAGHPLGDTTVQSFDQQLHEVISLLSAAGGTNTDGSTGTAQTRIGLDMDTIVSMVLDIDDTMADLITTRTAWLPLVCNDVVVMFELFVFAAVFPIAWYASVGWWYLLMNTIVTQAVFIIHTAATDNGDPLLRGDPRSLRGTGRVDLNTGINERKMTPRIATEGMRSIETIYEKTRKALIDVVDDTSSSTASARNGRATSHM